MAPRKKRGVNHVKAPVITDIQNDVESEVAAEDVTANDPKAKVNNNTNGSNGLSEQECGRSKTSKRKTVENDLTTETTDELPSLKKKKMTGPEYGCGTLVFCGGTNWDLIGRKQLPKGAKGAVGKNLWGPHRLEALNGIRVLLAVSGSLACHSVIVREDGLVMSWGRNDKGQLGHGDTKRRDIPTLIEALKGYTIVDAAMGRSHTLLLTDQGEVYSFGDNTMGQCGIGTKKRVVEVPKKVFCQETFITKVACGGDFSVILDSEGYLHSFGSPEYGQLGNNTAGQYFVTSSKLAFDYVLAPRRVNTFVDKSAKSDGIPVQEVFITSVACGTNHTVAMDTQKRCYTWGFGGYGCLGHAETKNEMTPRLVKFFDRPPRGVASVHAGGTFSLIINEHGTLFFWGQSHSNADATMYPKPVADLAEWNVSRVACSVHSIVVVADKSVVSWGPGPTCGELGYGENKPKSSVRPKVVETLENLHVHNVSCGYGHTLFVVRDETDEDLTNLNKLPVFSP